MLEAFFRRESHFFLTGGAALAGFHLGHRETHDLDLFTTEDSLERGITAVHGAADELGASLETLRTSPDFQRFLLRRADEAVIIDLVHERVPQLYPTKQRVGLIVVDPAEEIVTNKLCTLLSRAELRDLVDLKVLEEAGYRIEDFIDPASRKDGGLTPAQLAWVLGDLRIGEDARPPAGVSAADLRGYLADLRARLTRLAMPASREDA